MMRGVVGMLAALAVCGGLLARGGASPAPARRALSELEARRRSSLDRTFLRFGRSDPETEGPQSSFSVPPQSKYPHSNDIVLRFNRAGRDNFLRFGRTRPEAISFVRQKPLFAQLRDIENSLDENAYKNDEYDNPEEFETNEDDKRSSNFLRLGRSKMNFVRLGRSVPRNECNPNKITSNKCKKLIQDDNMKNHDFLRLGRSERDEDLTGSLEDAIEIDLPVDSDRKKRATPSGAHIVDKP